jgi:tetratricopeptide (TPR) repeat protein
MKKEKLYQGRNKMRNCCILLIIMLPLMLPSCGMGGDIAVEKKPEAQLRPSMIYNEDTVRKFVDIEPVYDSIAAAELKESEKFLPDFPDKAIHQVKRSITYRPTQSAYIRLGELLIDQGRYSEARQAYLVLNNVFPGFDNAIYFRMMCAAVLDPENGSLYPFMHEAMEKGITLADVKQFFEEEPRFDPIRNTEKFQRIIKYQLEDYGPMGDSLSMESFLDMFDKAGESFSGKGYPFIIGMDQLTDISGFYTNEWYWGCKHFLPDPGIGKWNIRFREYRRLPDPGAGIHAVIYAIDSSAHGARTEMRMVYYRLATYNAKGKVIDDMVIAKHLGEEVCTAEIISGNELKLSVLTRTWKRPFNHRDMDNEVAGTEPKGTLRVAIQSSGEILVEDGD